MLARTAGSLEVTMHRNVHFKLCTVALFSASALLGACNRAGREAAAKRDSPASEGAPNVAASNGAAHAAMLSDTAVRQAVLDELFKGPHANTGVLVVACTDGIVELTGTVDNLLAKDRAVAIAEEVKGVRAVSDRIQVKVATRPDEDIAKSVQRALKDDPATESYRVTASATAGVVHLTGSLDSWQEKQLAERLARGVRGVREVKNDISVNFLKQPPDAEIQRDVESRLQWDTFVNNGMITVQVNDGGVRLLGVTGSAAEKSAAYFDAWVHGVRTVDASKLEVEWWAKDEDLRKQKYAHRSDSEIASAIKDAMRYDPRVHAFNVDPQVTNGVVTLRGKVTSLKAKLAAESLAQHTVGVLGIENQLAVAANEPIKDADLKKRIDNALSSDAALAGSKVSSAVANGKVTLTGAVPTLFESAEAVDVASSMAGVTAIANHLTVASQEVAFVWRPYAFRFGPYVEGWYYVGPKPAHTDAELSRSIEKELEWNPFVNVKQVHVEVHEGKAILTGTVDSPRERRAAADSAIEGGAIAVDNQLKVG
jgi:osmotically-inducible protein OsmY